MMPRPPKPMSKRATTATPRAVIRVIRLVLSCAGVWLRLRRAGPSEIGGHPGYVSDIDKRVGQVPPDAVAVRRRGNWDAEVAGKEREVRDVREPIVVNVGWPGIGSAAGVGRRPD